MSTRFASSLLFSLLSLSPHLSLRSLTCRFTVSNPISLSFQALLTELAVANGGFLQPLIPGQDVADQLIDFYGKMSRPVLAQISVTYEPPLDGVMSKLNFRSLEQGSEILVCGQLPESSLPPPSEEAVEVAARQLGVAVQGFSAKGVEKFEQVVDLKPVAGLVTTGGAALASSASSSSFSARACAMLRIEQLLDDASLLKTDGENAKTAREQV